MPFSKAPARLFTLANASMNATQQGCSKVKEESQQGVRVGQKPVTERREKNPKRLLKVDPLLDRVGVAPHTPRCRPCKQQPLARVSSKVPEASGNPHTQ